MNKPAGKSFNLRAFTCSYEKTRQDCRFPSKLALFRVVSNAEVVLIFHTLCDSSFVDGSSEHSIMIFDLASNVLTRKPASRISKLK